MMDDDCLAVSCVDSSVSFSYLTETVSAVTSKRVLIIETAPSLRSFEAYPSTFRRDNCSQHPRMRKSRQRSKGT